MGGGDYEEVRDFNFTTGPLPDAFPDSEVGITKPLRYQHYYLQGEPYGNLGKIETYDNLSSSYFVEEDDNGNPLHPPRPGHRPGYGGRDGAGGR